MAWNALLNSTNRDARAVNPFRWTFLRDVLPICVAAAQLAFPAAVQAQAAAAEPGANDTQLETVVVTGTHLSGEAFSSPTPVTVVDAARMEVLGITNVADALIQMPSFRPTWTPQTNSFWSPTSVGGNFADLRSLGGARTLVLVDGRRYVASDADGQVDLNSIPSALVARTEVVTGGASAVYGTDAVAGVVNILLDTQFNGLKATVSAGQSTHGDNRSQQYSIVYGTHFMGGRGHVVAATEFEDDRGVTNCYDRSWCYDNVNVSVNPTPGVNGVPAQIRGNNEQIVVPYYGLVVGAAGPGATAFTNIGAVGTTFLPNGTPVPFQFGTYVGAIHMVGGQNSPGGQDPWANFPLSTPLRRFSNFIHADYDLTDHTESFLEASYADVRGSSKGFPALVIFAPLQLDNAYLPASVRAAAIGAGQTSLEFSESGVNGSGVGNSDIESDNITYRVAGGLKGDLADKRWSWDLYATYGRQEGQLDVYNNFNEANFSLAFDAVVGPNGNIVCRSTLTNPNNGCAPINLFGANQFSAAAKDYVTGTSLQTRSIIQDVIGGNFRGRLFNTWAGPVEGSVGAEYRQDSATGTVDPVTFTQVYQNNTLSPIDGEVHASEVYTEINVPLAINMFLADKLNFDGAFRWTRDEPSGRLDSWKIGVVYDPVSAVRFRATRSKDIRAPNISELYAQPQALLPNITDPVLHTQTLVPSVTGGNPNLAPEAAFTTTFGVVVRPDFLPGLQFSVDYYRINISNVIDSILPQQVVNLCVAGNTQLCQDVVRDNGGALQRIFSGLVNLATLDTDGIDIDLDYQLPLSRISSILPGAVAFRADATNVRKLRETDPATGLSIDRSNSPDEIAQGSGAGNAESAPEWQLNAVLTYNIGPLSVTGQERWVSAGRFDPTSYGPGEPGYNPSLPNSINNNHVDASYYTKLGAEYTVRPKMGGTLQFFAVVDNLFDQAPPPLLYAVYAGTYHDLVGRTVRVGARYMY